MEYLKTFESFNFENGKVDKTTIDFINEKISESEFINYLNNQIINESIIDNIKNFISKIKDKFIDIFYTFLIKASKIGFKIFTKIKSFFSFVFNFLDKIKKQNPTLFKVLFRTTLVIIFLIISTSTAYGQTTGNPVSLAEIDMAIGYLDQLKELSDIENLKIMKSIGYLIDIRDGISDIPLDQLGNESIAIAKSAIKTSNDMAYKAIENNDKIVIDKCIQLMDIGSKYVDVIFKKSGSSESIKLVIK
jgi:hypothetical protein